MAVKVERGIEHFRLVAPGAEGPMVFYGEVATLKIGIGAGAKLYTCDMEDPDCEHADVIVEEVRESVMVMNREVEEVLFDGEEEEDVDVDNHDDGDDDDDDDDDDGEGDSGPTLVS